jgi:hypothetical protein
MQNATCKMQHATRKTQNAYAFEPYPGVNKLPFNGV